MKKVGFWNIPNTVSALRIPILFIIIGFLYFDLRFKIIALLLIPILFFFDLLDGYLATKYKQKTDFGALFDISVDRIVELSFFFCFVDLRLIPLWIPLLLLTRGVVVDSIRSHGVSKGFVGWGRKGLIRNKYRSFIVNSVFFRALVNAKALSITLFILYLVFKDLITISGSADLNHILIWTQNMAWLFLVIFIIVNLARGIPYIIEFGRLE